MDATKHEETAAGRASDGRVAVVLITFNGGDRIATTLRHLTALPERPARSRARRYSVSPSPGPRRAA